jgi:hypothetical protein
VAPPPAPDYRTSWQFWKGKALFALQERGMERHEHGQRSAHLSAEPLARYADRLDTLRVVEYPADRTSLARIKNDKGLHDAIA